MTEREIKEYLEFMNNANNIRKCSDCPANSGFDSWQDRLPCGQYHCWVAVTVAHE